MVTLEDVKKDPEVDTYIRMGNEYLGVLGFTEHAYRHINLVANISRNILQRLDYPERDQELAAIAGYLHDIGNVVNRHYHGQSGALIAYTILRRMGMPPEEIATVVSAIGNHEEEYGHAVNPVGAALILADKSDVHRSRVRNQDFATFDIHDRVNYAVQHSFLRVDAKAKSITMELKIDLEISTVMEYFEIFLTRMIMCRRAADFLDCHFGLIINGARLL
ncbi:HD domain-containing protein [Calderihabitans maritimus]|uniref:Metal dependent phosphohydrolase n=1 Tax=Calderihabitans maritimus TaxID=1246530 RepID=A0A1Z5HT59_9FIRM|nr:HD domain-containing protein [Calderihabitans maritimus]GAW92704.1 metal dependent phosphohydrolase [Calderihabitans maritimus]